MRVVVKYIFKCSICGFTTSSGLRAAIHFKSRGHKMIRERTKISKKGKAGQHEQVVIY